MGSKEVDVAASPHQLPVETVVVMQKNNSTVSNGVNPECHVVVETAASPLMTAAPTQQIESNGVLETEFVEEFYVKRPAEDWCLNSVAAILCFFPIGLFALYFSIQTRQANRDGDRNTAKKWSRWAHLTGIAGGLAGIFIMATVLVLKYKYDYI